MTIECPHCCGEVGGPELLPEVVVSGVDPLRFKVLCECGHTVPVVVRVGVARPTTRAERERAGVEA